MEIISQNPEETRAFAFDLAKKIQNKEIVSRTGALIIGLHGDLGAGKTTFMKSFAEALGVKDTVQSPTFVILKRFEINDLGFKNLYHIDAYRLERGEDLLKLGWNEMVQNPTNIICIEWPERVEDILKDYLRIDFEHQGETTRKIRVNFPN